MALSRKSLKAMGLTDEQIESVIEMHSETVNDLKDKIGNSEKSQQAIEKYKLEVETLTEKLKEAQSAIAESEKYKEQYESTQAEYNKYKSEVETKAAKEESDKAFSNWLRANGYTDAGAAKIVKYGGYKPEFNKDGTIKGADKLAESVLSEWSEYHRTEKVEGAKTETPPTTGGKVKMTKADIMAIKDASERQQAIKENPDIFGIE